MPAPSRAVTALACVLALLASACGATDDQAEQISQVEAILADVVDRLEQHPDVTRATAELNEVHAAPGDTRDPTRLRVAVVSDAEDDGQIHERMVEAARLVWTSAIPRIRDLRVTGVREPEDEEQVSVDAWDLEQVPDLDLGPSPEQLEAVFGPRPDRD